MKFDTTKYDGAIVLTHERGTGRWATEVTSLHGKALRIGGFLDDASPDFLQSAALLTGLAVIRNRKLGARARIVVTSNRQSFLDNLLDNEVGALVMPRSVKSRLKREIGEFNLTFEAVEQKLELNLNNWLHYFVQEYKSDFPARVISQAV
jgi:hypothetical protein